MQRMSSVTAIRLPARSALLTTAFVAAVHLVLVVLVANVAFRRMGRDHGEGVMYTSAHVQGTSFASVSYEYDNRVIGRVAVSYSPKFLDKSFGWKATGADRKRLHRVQMK